MKRFAIGIFAALISSTASAQQLDPRVVIYRQLLDNANAQFVDALAQANAKVVKDQARIKELEDKYEPKKDGPPDK